MNYQDQVVVLTGASSGGIGSAMAKKFTDLGAKVALLDITVDRVQALADKLGLGSDRAFCAAVDVSNEESVKATVDAIVKHFGRIDVLVNAAGIPGPSARVEDYSFSDAKKVLSVNLFGTFPDDAYRSARHAGAEARRDPELRFRVRCRRLSV